MIIQKSLKIIPSFNDDMIIDFHIRELARINKHSGIF